MALCFVAMFWHPSGMRLRFEGVPEVCAALRPPAAVWELFELRHK